MNIKTKRKGQFLAIEEVLLFGMGIAIFSGTLLLVTDFRKEVSFETGTLQLEEVSQNIVSDLNAISLMGVNAEITSTIPKNIAGEPFTILGSENTNELLIYTDSGMLVEVNTSIKVSGTVGSSYGKLTIINQGQSAMMRGVTNY